MNGAPVSTPGRMVGERTGRVALALAGAVAVLALVLVVAGIPNNVVSVEVSGTGPAVRTVGTVNDRPYLPAAVPLALGALTFAALWSDRMRAAWVGIAGLLLFSGLFVFSTGLVFLPFVLGLLAATAASARSRSR